MSNDKYRQIIFESSMYAKNGVMTEQQAIEKAVKDFEKVGLNCIEYKNGAHHTISNYAKMAIRTASTRAHLAGEGEFRKSIGEHLIIMSRHTTSCKLCRPFENKVLIDDVYSGGTKSDGNYMLLSEAMEQGLYHPGCRHGHGTYYPELTEDENQEIAEESESAEEIQKSYNNCVKKEPSVTSIMREISSDVGCELSGLEHRVKTLESYIRKVGKEIEDYMESHPGVSYADDTNCAISHMYDTVRYTVLSNPDEFTSNFNKFVYYLKKKRYNINRVKNSLPDTNASYRGVNTVVTTPDGFNFEVQFHTPESFAIKEEIHPLYEEARKATTSKARRDELESQMKKLTQSIHTPPGAESIIPFDNLKGKRIK